MSTRSRDVVISAAIVLGLAIASCDKSPTRPSIPPPTSTTTTPPPPVVVRLDFSGPSTIAPGETVQLTARAVKSDSSVENISTEAQWSTSNPLVLAVSSQGLARGIGNGEVSVGVRYQGRGASAQVLVLPTGTYRLSGRITESGFPIRDVTVSVVAGKGEGLTSVSDGSGRYALYGVMGPLKIQAKKGGYLNRIDELDVSTNQTFDFAMTPERARPILSGTYALTIAAESCSGLGTLPDEARRRSYTAEVAQDGARLTVTLTGADFIITRGRGNHFDGFLDVDDQVTFLVGDAYYYYYYSGGYDLVERLSATTALVISGNVTAKATSSGIAGTLNGTFAVTQGTTAPFTRTSARCYANAHHFEMVR